MALGEEEYQRLRGTGRGSGVLPALLKKTKLWMGRDHLLLIESTGFSERYKRFYYRDIQAITITKTNRAAVYNATLGFLSAVCLLVLAPVILPSAAGGSRTPPNMAAVVFFGTFGGLSGIALIANVVLGASAVCHVRTAVQFEELGPLNRMKRARKALNRIRPFILAAQAELKEAQVEASAPARSQAAVTELPRPRPEAPAIRRPFGRAERLGSGALAAVLILNASALSLGGAFGSEFCYFLVPLLSVAAAIFAIVLLARSRDRCIPSGLLSVARLSIAQVIIYYVLVSGYAGYLGAIMGREDPAALSRIMDRVLVLPAPLGEVLASFSGILGFAALCLCSKYPSGWASMPGISPPPLPPPPPAYE